MEPGWLCCILTPMSDRARDLPQEGRGAAVSRPSAHPGPKASHEPLCPACGAVMRANRCKLACSRCHYFESCSDLLPPIEKVEKGG